MTSRTRLSDILYPEKMNKWGSAFETTFFKINLYHYYIYIKNNNSDQNDVKVRVWYKRDEIKVFGGFL